MANPWLTHLKKYRAAHPGLSLGQAMKQAKSTYKKTTKDAPKKKNKKTKEEVTDEQLGGALPPTRKRVETPMRKAVRELHQHWQPLWGKNQATPPFAQMRAALQYDDTSFDTRTRTYNIPESAPTGRGAFADHRETSHYVGKVLESIHPSLAVVYRGGATNSHVHDIATNMHMESYVRAGPLGGLQRVTHKFK